MAIAQGISKQLRIKKESVFGTPAGATGAKLYRRVTSAFNLTKETYTSAEIRTDYQTSDMRHGVRAVDGSISAELSPTTYSELFAAALAKDFAVGGTTATLTDVTATATAPHFVRGSGSFITDGFKVGDIVRWTGFSGVGATANNAKNFYISALTATEMTVIALDGSAVVDDVAGDSVTCSVVGKKSFVPQTGHTADSFTVEEFFDDINQSKVFVGNKVNSVSVSIPATGIATSTINFMGQDLAIESTSEYFTTPTALTSTGVTAGVNGLLLVDGVAVGLITSADFTINRNITGEAVLGSNIKPFLFEGRVAVDGTVSVYFQDNTFGDKFTNETPASISFILTTTNEPNADFISFTLPKIKFGSDTRDDGEKGIVSSMSFTALLPDTSTGYERSTIVIQDSTL